MVLLVLGLLAFVIITLKVVKNNDFQKTILYFKKYLAVVFIGLFALYLMGIILTVINMNKDELLLVLFIKTVIQLLYFSQVFINTKRLLFNLSTNNIFDDLNCFYTKKIGTTFVYLSITEIISGLVIGFFRLISDSSYVEFRLTTNSTVILYLVIGLILLILSLILKKAIEIYKENQLTI
jgi:hypothetical protein